MSGAFGWISGARAETPAAWRFPVEGGRRCRHPATALGRRSVGMWARHRRPPVRQSPKAGTFEVLAQALCPGGDSPRVLTGDFNEPRAFLDSGQMVTFAGERDDVDGVMAVPRREWGGRSLADWSAGVRSVLVSRIRNPCAVDDRVVSFSGSPSWNL